MNISTSGFVGNHERIDVSVGSESRPGAVTPACILLRVRRRFDLLLPLVAALALNIAWFMTLSIPFLASCAIMLLVNGYLSGRMVICRVTEGDYYGMDWLLMVALAAPNISSPFDIPSGYHLIWSLVIIAYLLVRVLLDFKFTLLKLEGYLKPRELIRLALGLSYYLGK